ncbi:Molybdate/tungstate import ATP-binding protein WtpC [Candidatus Methanobinarius endosymbioticus]|uniref:Molybdate/tungstate import ATP-binding protein WtpC n=1 Tax=Candidatus Methanobinarius endosymbioticus TaxID=2006182 RepID=A0A366MA89_9EURY|nr:Molybdate/tungstate import ATP-binding protein WtpC [Candidatus Methanobinarius endosymbioticus]
MHAALYGVPHDIRQERIDEVLELIALRKKADEEIKKADEETKNYSGGMKRRLETIRGLIQHPKLLFLDEPSLGLDIQTRESIWNYIEDLKTSIDITILLTTHYLEEADSLCDEIAIIDQGKIVKADSPKNLKIELKADTITLTTLDPTKTKKLCEVMEKEQFVQNTLNTNNEITLLVEKRRKSHSKSCKHCRK